MSLRSVYGRLSNTTAKTLYIKRRIVGAVRAVKGNFTAAKANLDLSLPTSGYAISTIKRYFSEFKSLTATEQKFFLKTNITALTKAVNSRR